MIDLKKIFLVQFDKNILNLNDLIWKTIMASVFTSHGLLYDNEFSLIAGGLIYPFGVTFFRIWDYLLKDLITYKKIFLSALYIIILIFLPICVSALISYLKSIFPENTIKLNYQLNNSENKIIKFPSENIKNKLSITEDFQLILYFAIVIMASIFIPISILKKDNNSLISLGIGVGIIAYLCIIGILMGYDKKEEKYYLKNNSSLIIFIVLIILSLSISYIIHFMFFDIRIKRS